MFGMDAEHTNIIRGSGHAEFIVGGGFEKEDWRNANGETESKTETSGSIGIPLLGLKAKSETNSQTKENKTTLGISLFGIDAGYIFNIHTELFIPLIVEKSKPNK